MPVTSIETEATMSDYNEEVRPGQHRLNHARPHISNVANWHIPHNYKCRCQHYLQLSQAADITRVITCPVCSTRPQ